MMSRSSFPDLHSLQDREDIIWAAFFLWRNSRVLSTRAKDTKNGFVARSNSDYVARPATNFGNHKSSGSHSTLQVAAKRLTRNLW